MKTFLAVIGFLVTLILSPIWMGYVLSTLWTWFVVPAFHTHPISIALAIGLSLVMGMFMSRYSPDEEGKEKKHFAYSMVYAFLYPLLALGMGAIVHAFAA